MNQTKALRKLVIVQTKLYLREPLGVFFSLLFAPLLLIMMGIIFGNDPVPMFNGHGFLDVNVPSYAAIVIGMIGLLSVPIETSTRRESGVLRRFRATPLQPLTYIVGDVVVYFAISMLGIFLLFLLGITVYQVQFDGRFLPLMAGIFLSVSAFLALGYVIASLAPNPRIALLVGNVLIITMIFLSGNTLPLEIMPEIGRKISLFNPMTHVVTLLRGLWFGDPFSKHLFEVVFLGGVLVVGTTIAARMFRWE
jgi:ABC-2 type transport system permease protein